MSFAIERYMADEVLAAVQRLGPIADEAGLTMVAARPRLGPAPARARLGDHRRDEPEHVHGNAAASGVELDDATIAAIDEALADVAITEPRPAGFAREGVKHR